MEAFMEVMLDEALVAKLQAAQIDINVHVTASINITPFVARQKVNVLLLDKIGTGLFSEAPGLVATQDRLRWRVPVALGALGLPGRGHLGQVGVIDVDVQTGEVLVDDNLIHDLTRRATQLVASPAS
jgi:hypothetical protein